MTLLSPNPAGAGAIIDLHVAATVSAASAFMTVGQFQVVTFEVFGTWTGNVTLLGELKSASSTLHIYDSKNVPLTKVTKNGIYFALVSGYAKIRTYATVASGSVSVSAKLSQGLPVMRGGGSIVEVGRVLAQTVGAGANVTVFTALEVIGFPFIRVGVRANSSGLFTVRYLPAISGSLTYGAPSGYIDIVQQSLRGYSDKVDNFTGLATFNILNSDVSSHDFDLIVFGVRG